MSESYQNESQILLSSEALQEAIAKAHDWLVTDSDVEDALEQFREIVEVLQASQRAAEEAAKTKGEFLANMSHEIRTPMNGVIGMTELLLDTDLSAEQRDLAELVRSSAHSLLSIINDILDFSKIESGKFELSPIPFDLRKILSDLERFFSVSMGRKDIQLVVEVMQNVPDRLFGDPDRLKQILTNLVSNAVKFTTTGGGIVVLVNLFQMDERGASLEFYVCDSGIGIDEARQAKIFDAFTQADNTTTRHFGGTGLGLTICSQLVDLMGGMMTVESIPGRGSTFSFTAYFEIPDEQVEEQARESSFIPLLDESLRILLAEDNKVNQKLALKLLEKADHQITVANNGREAVDYCEAIEFDIIFMDIQMPIMGGEEAVELIRAKEKKSGTHTPIVALTAHAMKGDKERYLSHGMDGYVSKPIKRAELFSVIEDLVTKSRESDTKHQSEYPE